jgi:cation:H+ antiporter
MFLSLAMLIIGLGLLTLAADRFVVAAARVSAALGLSAVLIGALVIGLGTSAPEMLVSGLAAGRGEIDIALGNVVGSNTANLTLVLGSTALVMPIVSRLRTIAREGALMMLAMAVFAALLWNLELSRLEAGLLMLGMVVAAGLLIWWSALDARAGRSPIPDPDAIEWQGNVRLESIIGISMLALTLLGADLLVRGAIGIADDLGISSAFVGLVIVSVGTSLPELATALAAARRGQTDLVLGNVLGSNLFNTLAVAGLAGLVGPGLADEAFHNAVIVMLIAGAAAGLFSFRSPVRRWEGAILLAIFVGFVAISA